jgi:hypothetical protein
LATPILTKARQSVWDSIENWAPIAAYFKTRRRFEDKIDTRGATWVPALGELPAIEIFPAVMETPWVNNIQQRAAYALTVRVWTPHHYLKNAGVFALDDMQPGTAALVDDPQCVLWSWAVLLKLNWQPSTDVEPLVSP